RHTSTSSAWCRHRRGNRCASTSTACARASRGRGGRGASRDDVPTEETAAAPSPATAAAPTPRRGCAAPLVLVAMSLLLALLLAEVALRITGIAATGRGSAWFAGGNHPRFLFQPDVQSGYTLRPGFHGTEVGPAHEFV